MGAVADEDHQIGVFHRFPGTPDAYGFHGIGGFPDTGGVNEPQTGGTQQHRFLHGIPGGAGNVGDDAAVKPCQRVQKTGFAHIGFAHNGGGHALPEDTPLTVGLQQGIQRFGIAAKACVVLFKAKIFNILVGIVQHRVEMAAQVRQVVVNGRELLLQLAAHLPGGVGGGVGGVRFDEIDDGFRLRQIHFSVEKGALGEFSPLGGKRPGEIQSFQPCSQHGRGAVAMKFHGVLAGVGVGRAGDHCHALVNDPALLVVKGSENQTAVGRFPKGFSAVQCKYLIRDRDAPVTRQADDADGGNGSAGGYGSDNVGHKKPLLLGTSK